MRIALVRPSLAWMVSDRYVDEARMEPLQLGILAALCPPGDEVRLHDDRCEPVPFDEPADLAALTVETFTARRAYQIAAEYRRRGVPVVLGGFHPTLAPAEAAQHADAIVTGDAEQAWPALLADARAGRLRPAYHGAPGTPQPGVVARRDLFAGKGYLPITLTQFGRGCPHACAYCATSAFHGRRHALRSVGEVVREIEERGRSIVFFVDDNIVADVPAAKRLFRALAPLGIRWVSQGTIDMTHDRELMDLMAASGCLGHVVGFESVEGANLTSVGKGVNLRCSPGYGRELAVLREYGLQTWAAFTLGYDEDTPEGLARLLDFAFANRFAFAAFNVLMPYPGTPLYARLEAEGRLLHGGRWWLEPGYRFGDAAFRPARMSPEELTRVAWELRTRWSSPLGLARRFLDPRTNMRTLYRIGVYWAYNLVFRRDIRRKRAAAGGR